jgi:hypothetical protein
MTEPDAVELADKLADETQRLLLELQRDGDWVNLDPGVVETRPNRVGPIARGASVIGLYAAAIIDGELREEWIPVLSRDSENSSWRLSMSPEVAIGSLRNALQGWVQRPFA